MTLQLGGDGHDAEAQLRELEEPRITVRIEWVAARIITASAAFFFVGFFFAYVYLKSVDSHQKWMPKPDHPSIAFGAIILATIVASAVLVRVATLAINRVEGGGEAWQLLGGASLLLAIVGVVLQVWQLAHHLGFVPSAAYPSVFVGWSAFLALIQVGGIFWLATLVSQSERARGTGRMSGAELETFRAQSGGFAFFWTFMAVVEIVAFVLLYLVR